MHTSRPLSLALAFALAIQPLSIFAQNTNTGIVDYVDNKNKISQTAVTMDYKSFTSCEQMNVTITDYIQSLVDAGLYNPQPIPYLGGRGMMMDNIAVESADIATTSAPMAGAVSSKTISSQSNDFSTTNIQIGGVDEPDILKTNGKVYVYANAAKNMIYLVNSPLDTAKSTITLNNAKVAGTIALPETLRHQPVQLFVTNNTLIILANRYSYDNTSKSLIDQTSKTMVINYDISEPSKAKLIAIQETDGAYSDARMIGNQLHVLTTAHVNRFALTIKDKKVAPIDALKFLPETIIRRATDKTGITSKANCTDIHYLLPSVEMIKQTGQWPQFTQISTVDITKPTEIMSRTITVAQPGQIHMSKDSLYLTQHVRLPNNWSCPLNARCAMPIWGGGDMSQTLIHKFDRNNKKRGYIASALVAGSPLTQYSMDEDANDNFRIVTSQRSPSQQTNFYILGSKLNFRSKVTGIAPGEQFQSSRYIGDKLYLVTFQRTDPLFVIDTANPDKAKVIGALKVPGYSTYLHPHSVVGSKQYLIGLGYDANEQGQQKGIQLALYEVDYSKKETADSKCSSLKAMKSTYAQCLREVDTNNIRVSLLKQTTMGGVGSLSPALDNPRVFVIDKNNNVTLPLVLADQKKLGKNCRIQYDVNDKEINRNCNDNMQYITNFVGLKRFSLSIKDGIKENFSQNYSSRFNLKDGNQSPWNVNNYAMRVGYAGDALFFLSDDFGHFMLPGSKQGGKYVEFR